MKRDTLCVPFLFVTIFKGENPMPIYRSQIFWTLIAGLIAFVAKYFAPSFPFSEVEILAALIFVLNLFKIQPELKARGLLKK
jgi:hypothetical protein